MRQQAYTVSELYKRNLRKLAFLNLGSIRIQKLLKRSWYLKKKKQRRYNWNLNHFQSHFLYKNNNNNKYF